MPALRCPRPDRRWGLRALRKGCVRRLHRMRTARSGPRLRGCGLGAPVLRSRRATTDEKLLQLDIELSPAQRQAAERLLGTEAKRALVWAACGAGKTEVVYPLIERALQQGSDVLFAVPRRDIVVELGRRVQAAFPGVPVQALYGEVRAKFCRRPPRGGDDASGHALIQAL